MQQTTNKPLNVQQLKLLGPQLRRSVCALIAQTNQLRFGPLAGRYASLGIK